VALYASASLIPWDAGSSITCSGPPRWRFIASVDVRVASRDEHDEIMQVCIESSFTWAHQSSETYANQ